jgi:protein deglycase
MMSERSEGYTMKVLIPIANGSEEMEAVILIDCLRRAQWEVTVAGLSNGVLTASRGVKLVADVAWSAVDSSAYDMIVLPGGVGGTQAFCEHDGIKKALRDFMEAGKWVGAICAAAKVLSVAGLLNGRRFTCYPGVEAEMAGELCCVDELVVVDRNLVTSQGPGTAFAFALKLIELGADQALADTVRRGLLL